MYMHRVRYYVQVQASPGDTSPQIGEDHCLSFLGARTLSGSPLIPNAYTLQALDKHKRNHAPLMSHSALAAPCCRQTTRNTFP